MTIRRTWRSIRVRAGRCGAVLTAALVSWAVLSQTAPALGGSWSATGADSLDVSVIGFYPIVSARGIWDCAAFVPPGGHEYALVCADSLHLVDLADPTAPQRTAVIAPAVASNFVDVAVRGRYAYAAHRRGPILIIDLLHPAAPLVVGQIPQSEFCACSCGHPCTNAASAEIETLFIDERGILYVTGIRCGEGIQMYDLVANPTQPRWLCHEHTFAGAGKSYYVHDVYVRDAVLFVSRSQGVPSGDPLPRWDILDGDPLCPSSPGACGGSLPAFISSFRHTGEELHAHSSWRLDDDDWLLTADESTDGHIRVWNIASLTQPVEVAEYHPDLTCHSLHNLYVKGTVGYAAWYNHGIEVFSVADPAAPERLGYYHHPERWRDRPEDICCDPTHGAQAWCYGVPHLDPFYPSGIFVATDIDQGLLVGRYQKQAVGLGSVGSDPDGGRGQGGGVVDGPGRGPEIELLSATGTLPIELALTLDPRATEVRLELFDAAGVQVASLPPIAHSAMPGAVRHDFQWDGRRPDGVPAAGGIYFARARGVAIGKLGKGSAKIVLLAGDRGRVR
ncbi:MAG: hypothetical protein IPK72_02460 [Candidatus Eisenbacteria bacterium]|nr:hypothetical protein [Candidatus Eisenbacteria bacterium]